MYPTPPLTYYYMYLYPSPYLLPWAPPAFLEGWDQDRVRGCHLTAKYYHGGVVHFWLIQSGGGGGAHVASNTEYFHVLLEVGGPLGMPTTYYPYSSPYLQLPLFLPLLTTPYLPLPLFLPLLTTPYLPLPLLLPLPTTPYLPLPLLLPLPTTPYLPLPLLLPLPTTTPTPPLTYYPLPTTTPTPPLTYYSPGAWSEVTSMVTYVMMMNSLIHYCQSMKHIYMDTVYKLN